VAHAKATTDPLIEFVEQLQLRGRGLFVVNGASVEGYRHYAELCSFSSAANCLPAGRFKRCRRHQPPFRNR
ncbi:MAG: hypothetical protein O2945_15350, partial [Planctomycetota bacterium]|nr:hypothetical protein [Planctomycetota bacterium]